MGALRRRFRSWAGDPRFAVPGAGLLFGLMALPLMGPRRAAAVAAGVVALRLIALARLPERWHPVRGAGRAVERMRGVLPEPPPWVRAAVPWLFVGALAALSFALDPYTLDVATTAGIYALLALGLNVVVGMAGLLVLGFAAFYAVGAYTYALLNTQFHLGFWVCLPVGGALAALFGLLLGLPTLRLRGDYLAIVTLGFGEITRITLNNWDTVTNGPNGILGIAPPSLFGHPFVHPRHYFLLALAFVAASAFLLRRLDRSRIGRAWVAMREDETAAEAMGLPTLRLKLLAFAMAAFWGGVAGVFFAGKQLFVSPESFNFLESVMVLCMVVLGGMGSVPGAVLGALLLSFLPEVLRGVDQYRLLAFGAAMVLMMRYRPSGLWPEIHRYHEVEEGRRG